MDGVLLHCFSLFIRNRDELRIGFRLLTFRGCCYLRRCCSFRSRMDDIIGACIGISVVTDTDDLYRGQKKVLLSAALSPPAPKVPLSAVLSPELLSSQPL